MGTRTAGRNTVGVLFAGRGWAERERHGSADDNFAIDACAPLELSHPAAQPFHARFDLDNVARPHRLPVAHALDAHEEDQLFAVLRLREDQDRADLRDGLRQDRRRQHGWLTWLTREVPLVQRDILDPDNALVRFERRDPIHEEERIAMRNDPLDRGVIER
jgi:hypothetical protein